MPLTDIFLALKFENFVRIFYKFFLIFAQNIDCGYTLEPPRRGGSNEYPQSMFYRKNKKNRYTPANPSFFYIKVGFGGVYITRTCFRDVFQDYFMSSIGEVKTGEPLGKTPISRTCLTCARVGLEPIPDTAMR